VAGALTFPSIRYTGRLAGDPLNTMTLGEADLIVGSGSQLNASGRWGDYSSLVVDPVDDCTFWYTQEYYAVTSDAGWRTRIGSFSLPGCASSPPSNLPVVTIVASAPTATEAGPTSGAFTVTRTGDTSLPLTVLYTVGGTASAGADYTPLPGTVTIAAGDTTAVIQVVPVDDPAVEPNESVIVALTPASTYVLGSGGAVVTIVSEDLPPDLVVATLTVPATAGAGSPITLNDTTKNQGSGPAQPSVTGFYLSTNTALDAADVSLGTRAVPLLAPGASDSASTVLTVPSDTTARSYYVLAKADAGLSIAESSEANNVKAASVAVGPDLVVATLTVPATGAAGAPITVADTTKNQGGGSAAASVTSFYLSANVLLDAADVLLGSRPTGPLAAGVSEAASTTLSIPAGTATGLYYIIAKADGTGLVTETQELNNTKYGAAMKIGPDLIESGIVVPAVAGAGIALVVSDTVKNQGSGAAGASTTSFYLSTNYALDGNDVFIGSRSVPPLAAGVTSAASTPVVIPAGTVTGTYYVIVRADANDEVVESAETNNTTYTTTKVGADLTEFALTLSATAVAGGTTTVTDTVKNVGGSTAAPTTTRFYLSTNYVFDAADVLIGSRIVPAIDAGATNAAATSLQIPAQTTTGLWYYIIAVADADNVVTEPVETNNTRAAALRITGGS
jgi:subtilase family serine protease